MVINRDRHNKYSVDGYLNYSNTDSTTTTTQGTTDNSQLSSTNAGGGGSTTIIYQGGSSKPAFNQVNVGLNAIVATNDLTAFGIAGSGKIQVSLENNIITITCVEDEPTDQYWQVDEAGNLYTTRNVYSTLEISAYGFSEGEVPGGIQYLSELKDVDVTNLMDDGILQYNSTTQKWEVTDGSSIRPDLTGYAKESWVTQQLQPYATQSWVTEQINVLIGDAPDVLDTIYEIAEALNNDPDYVKDISNNLASLTNKVATIETNLTNLTARVVSLEDMFEWDGTKIKAKADLYGVGEISAYGYSEGETPTGAQYLHELKDVTLTDLVANQLLQWNGSKWVNINKDEVGLNESELANYLTENNYVTESYITWDNISNKPSSYQTEITKITGLNSSWINLLKVAPTDYVTRWPTAAEVGALTQNTADSRYALTTGTNATGTWGINISGNASTADKWKNERVFALSGAITGSITIDGSENVTLITTYSDGNIGVLDNRYVNVSGDTMTGELVAPTVKANTRVQIGDAYLVYESATKAIKVCYKDDTSLVNLYATGEVSAYDFDGEATGFSMALRDLTDVSLTDIASGLLLQWNGTKWVNIDKNEVGLNESQLAEYLTDNQYAKKSDISIAGLTDLHLSWDALLKAQKPTTLAGYGITDAYTKTDADGRYVLKTGDTVTGNLSVMQIKIENSNEINVSDSTNSNALYIAYRETSRGVNLCNNNAPLTYGSAKYAILHAGNYTSTLDSRYLLKSSYTAADVLAKLKTVDGSGSGLDADTVDGVHNGNLAAAVLNSQGRSGMITGKPTKTGLQIFDVYTDDGSYPVGFGNLLRLRGGVSSGSGELLLGWSGTNNGIEHIYYRNNRDMAETWSEWRTLAFTTDNVASATKLATARTIWGQTFDGTKNVSGSMTGVININTSTDFGIYYNGNYFLLNQLSGGTFINDVKGTPLYLGYRGTSDLRFYAGGSAGNVGTYLGYWNTSGLTVNGTTTLNGNVTIAGTTTLNGVSVINNNMTFNKVPIVASGAAWIYFGDDSYSKGRIGWDISNDYFWIQGGPAGSYFLIAGRNAAKLEQVRVNCNNFDAEGNVTAKGEVTAFATSDRRLKTNIQPLTDSLSIIRQLDVVTFDWTELALKLKANKTKHSCGLVALEVLEIIPGIVTTNMYNQGYLGIDYTKLIPFALAGIKEVDDEVTRLKLRVEQLELRLSKYESIV